MQHEALANCPHCRRLQNNYEPPSGFKVGDSAISESELGATETAKWECEWDHRCGEEFYISLVSEQI